MSAARAPCRACRPGRRGCSCGSPTPAGRSAGPRGAPSSWSTRGHPTRRAAETPSRDRTSTAAAGARKSHDLLTLGAVGRPVCKPLELTMRTHKLLTVLLLSSAPAGACPTPPPDSAARSALLELRGDLIKAGHDKV